MSKNAIIQHVTSIIILIISVIFGLLGLFNVNITINQSDVNTIIFGLGSIIAALIELVPFIVQTLKDKNFKELYSIVNDVVYAVEELEGLSGYEKKQKALDSIAQICAERGIAFDAIAIGAMIESVIQIYNTVVKK